MRNDVALPDRVYPHDDLTHEIIGASFRVHNELGYGFLESVYRRALAVELQIRGIAATQEVPFELTYRGAPIGTFRADLVVDSTVVVEVKTGLLLDPIAVPQALNYVKASRLQVGLIAYFGPRVSVKRVIFTSAGHSVFE
jgi:GxxExxY protein